MRYPEGDDQRAGMRDESGQDAQLTPAVGELDQRLQGARPRLLRLSQAMGVAPDVADDVVQETLVAAWGKLHQLRSPDHFDAWLDGICRNQCRMSLRGSRRTTSRQQRAFDGQQVAHDAIDELADPLATDPIEAVDRHDLAVLIDRALGHLSPDARSILELRYLKEIPESEVAESLELTGRALEARLYRARRQFREVLGGPLRAEAEAFGLALPMAPGWQQTRLWCNRCGQRRLIGIFEALSQGSVELRLRCPECSSRLGIDMYRSKGIVPLNGLHSFRPALNRALRALSDRTSDALATGWDVCLHCESAARRRVVGPGELPSELLPALGRHWVVAACQGSACSRLGAWPALEPAIWPDPEARRFMAEHPRWVAAPETRVEQDGVPAIRFHLVDTVSSAQLVVFADPHTLQSRGAFQQ